MADMAQYRTREATVMDLGSLCQLVIEAMDDDPLWNYRFPGRKYYPDVHLKETMRNWHRFFKPTPLGRWMVNIVEKCEEVQNPYVLPVYKLVAFAVWLVPDLTIAAPPAGSPSTAVPGRPDVNVDRLNEFNRVVAHAKTTYLDPKFGVNQMHLQYLGTHPSERLKGLAMGLLQIGLDLSKQASLNVTTYASDAGRKLYEKQGFQAFPTFTVRTEQDKVEVQFTVMVRASAE